jgi:hypothetical protein
VGLITPHRIYLSGNPQGKLRPDPGLCYICMYVLEIVRIGVPTRNVQYYFLLLFSHVKKCSSARCEPAASAVCIDSYLVIDI